MRKSAIIGATIMSVAVLSGLANFSQMVGRKEFVRVSRQGFRSSWKARHAGKRGWCTPET
jgi:hypothetical protein